MTLVQKFTEKYGINPIKLVEDANLKNFGLAKSLGLQRLLEVYIEDKNLNIEVNNEFLKDLVESFAEAGEKFPENVKASVYTNTGIKFEVPNQMSSIPKSKGTLENFKDIVGTDDLRPIMMGVYVSDDGFIVGTDAHKLVKQKNNGLLSQTDYAGKIIDLSKYIKSKGKLIDFIDGVYPKYDAVIPRENPYEDRHLSTYAFYNYVKSSLNVKRLVEAEIFNVNFNLMTGTSGETTMFSFAYHVLFDSLNFAMLNGWDFFTLRYSEPNRAVVFDFDGDNIILVMPIIDSYGSGASGGSMGTIPLTTEEVQEKYRLGLTNQKKPAKAPKKPTVSAPASSEPFKKFEGNLSDTTYVHRSQIESINLVNGEVLGKNDVIDGFYRVNKKMSYGGNLGESGTKTYKLRAEGLNDFIAFLQNDMYFKVKSFTVEITGFPDVVVTFETASPLSEIKEKLKGVPDSHVMLETVKPIKEYTGEREGSYAHGGSMYAGGGTLSAMEEREIQNFVGSLFNQAENKIENDGGMSLFVLSDSINAVKGSLSNPKFYLGVKKTSSSKPIYVVGSGYLSSEMLMYDSYKSDTRFLETESVNEARKFLKSKVENQILHLKSLGKMAHGGSKPSSYEIGDTVTFNSVLGGTKTGTIFYKIYDEGFRIKTADGFATVKKSAIV